MASSVCLWDEKMWYGEKEKIRPKQKEISLSPVKYLNSKYAKKADRGKVGIIKRLYAAFVGKNLISSLAIPQPKGCVEFQKMWLNPPMP